MDSFGTTGNTYQVRTEQFEGPFDLLLSLIEKRKLFINDISLSTIADDYVMVVKETPYFPKDQVTGFVLIASTLVLLKSRSLLPDIPLSDEEEDDINDLQNRLRLYQRMKELSLYVDRLYKAEPIYSARPAKHKAVYFAPDKDTTISGVTAAIEQVLLALPAKNTLPQAAVKNVIRLEDVISRLNDKIQAVLRMSFQEFHSDLGSDDHERRGRIIVSFIALLELVKIGNISATQVHHHGEIIMEARDLGVPRYNDVL